MVTYSLPIAAMAGIAFYVGIYHLAIHIRRRTEPRDLSFALLCLLAGAYDICCIGLYNATSVEVGGAWQRAQLVLAVVGIGTMVWFVRHLTGRPSTLLSRTLMGLYMIPPFIGIFERRGWVLSDQANVKHVSAPFGFEFTYYELGFGPLSDVASFFSIILLVYIAWVAVDLYRAGRARRAAPLALVTLFLTAASINDGLVAVGAYTSLYLIEYAFLAVVLVMGFMLTDEVVEAAQTREALAESERRLEQAERMESIGRVAGGIAHDFNNLLTPILGYTRVALRQLPEGDPSRERLELITEAANRAAGLTRQLLAFSSRQVLHVRVIDLNEVCVELFPLLEQVIREDIEIMRELGPGPLTVRADPAQLEQILMNLAVNARDAMPEGGTLCIRTWREADTVLLEVSDDGAGMDSVTRENLFEPFFTTKGRGQGTGLGLATVHGIVRQHDGSIEVDSEPGSGTRIRIRLPWVDEPLESATEDVFESPAPVGKETVLVVDDDELVRGFATRVLRGLGYGVLVAERPSDALAIASTHEGEIALVVTDIVMPEMDGRRLVEALREESPDLPGIFISGYPEDVIGDRVSVANALFVNKPFTEEELAKSARLLLDR